jgi:hypothetical protein
MILRDAFVIFHVDTEILEMWDNVGSVKRLCKFHLWILFFSLPD